MADVVVVGGGIAGLAAALELRRLGAGVTLVEARYPGAGNSGRNVGRIRRIQLTPDLTRFAVAASGKWDGLARLLGGRNPLLYPTRYAWLLYEDEEAERVRPLAPMWRALGARSRLLGRRGALRAVPALAGGEPPVGAVVAHAAIVHHDAAVHGYLLACREWGVELRLGERVSGVIRAAGQIAGAVTEGGEELPAAAVVNAAGGRSAELARAFGVEPPNRPVRREVLVTEPSRPFVTPAVTFYRPHEGWFNQTLRGELVAGVVAPDEPEGMTEAASLRFLARTARVLLAKAPRLAGLRVIRQWAGVYDLTPDRRPLVGEHAGAPGVYALNGWSGRGVAFAPVAAELLARLIVRGERDELIAPFRPDRFPPGEAVVTSGDYYGAYRA
jgi:sarcosine oxidase, subunit beta